METSMMWKRWVAVTAVACGFAAIPLTANAEYVLETTIAVPATPDNSVGGNFNTFDISFFDPTTQLDYVADRSNAAVDVFSGITESFVTQVGGSGHLFAGQTSSSDTSGPDGVLVANPNPSQNQLWAGDGNSTLKTFAIDTTTNPPTYTGILGTTTSGSSGIDTGGANRVDEGAFDPKDNRVIFANDAEKPFPFLTVVDAATGAILNKITFDGTGTTPKATAGIEQTAWDPATQKFYVAVPQINGIGAGGIAELDNLGNVIKTFDLTSFGIIACSPTGLSVGKGSVLGVNCGNKDTQVLLFDPTANGGNGAVVKSFDQFSGGDEDWYDPTTGLFYFADSNNSSGPVLGIIDGNTDSLFQILPTVSGAHSVAVDPLTGDIFMPFGGTAMGNTTCPTTGCIAVFEDIPEPASLVLVITTGLLGLVGLGWRRRPARPLGV
jgi:PEP-CTERM motif